MSSSTVEQIKERLGIVDVVGSYIKLEKAGSNFKARCPFHSEKTPSFMVSPARNTFYCFGCAQKGDIFTFVEQFEGLDFKGALKVLADRAGVQIVFEEKSKKDERDILYKILEETCKFFESQLKNNTDANKYLKDRGLEDSFKERFRIGYALTGWSSLYEHLITLGFKDGDINWAGLIKKGDKGYYDRFRSRIMFPISDSSGRVVAFSGRIFPLADDIAKYINSPETELYNKSRILYGFDKAKLSIRKSNFSIVVEGQMDLVMSHQAGFINTVALSGTALTPEHITMLSRLSGNIVLALDADKAGVASAGRSAEAALAAKMDVKVARMPNGVDPADLVKEDPEKFKKVVRESLHIVDFYLDILEEEGLDRRAYGKNVEQKVLPFVARIPSKIEQMHFISRIAGRLGVSADVITEEVSKISVNPDYVPVDTPKIAKNKVTAKGRKVNEEELFKVILWQESVKKPVIDIKKIKEELKDIVGEESFNEVLETQKGFEQDILFSMEDKYLNSKTLERDITDMLERLKIETLKEKSENIQQEIRMAEGRGDHDEGEKQLKKYKEISDKIESLQANRGGQS